MPFRVESRGSIRRRFRDVFGVEGAELIPVGISDSHWKVEAFFVPFRVESRGSIRRRFRDAFGVEGAELIPAGISDSHWKVEARREQILKEFAGMMRSESSKLCFLQNAETFFGMELQA